MVQVVTGDSQEEVLIFRDRQTLHHYIYISSSIIVIINMMMMMMIKPSLFNINIIKMMKP